MAAFNMSICAIQLIDEYGNNEVNNLIRDAP
jgi:hypothetical protein